MSRLVWIGAAGAAGALARYVVGVALGIRSFPWATLGINVLGSFLLGAVLTLGALRGWSDHVTLPLGAGFLGSFTTFSTFSYETQLLLRTDRPGAAAIYVVTSLIGGVIAAFGGYGVARLLA